MPWIQDDPRHLLFVITRIATVTQRTADRCPAAKLLLDRVFERSAEVP
jgi:hypothetical protein